MTRLTHPPSSLHTHTPSTPTRRMRRRVAYTTLLSLGCLSNIAFADADVKHYDLSLEINPQPLSINGTATLTIQNTSATTAMTSLPLNLVGYTVSGVTVNGTNASVTRNTNVMTITLPMPLAAGASAQVSVQYSGTPTPYTTDQGDLGVMQGRGITYAINVTEGAQYWFPCRDQLDDKASVDFHMILHAGNISAGPGHLQQVVTLSNGKQRHDWQMTQEVTPYLLSFAFSDRYVEDSYDLGSAYGPLQADIALLTDTWADAVVDLEPLPDMVGWLESRYGKFPYDHVGIHEISFQGAVEQPGNIAMGSYYFSGTGQLSQYFAHELSHTWFQDLVTIRTWNDIFLSESIAVWHEILWTEQSQGLAAADTMAMTNLEGYRVGMASEGVFPLSAPKVLFGYTVYFKGSVVWRLLEHLLGRDMLLTELNSYLKDSDGIADLNDFLSRPVFSSNPNVANFRAEWIDRGGLPGYQFGWKASTGTNGTSVSLRLTQDRDPVYTTPIDVQVQYGDGTTETVTLHPSSADHVEEICFANAPTAATLDPRKMVPRGQEGSVNAPSSTICDEGSPSCSGRFTPSLAAMPVLLSGVLGLFIRRRRANRARRQ